jgi:hypothetical protein
MYILRMGEKYKYSMWQNAETEFFMLKRVIYIYNGTLKSSATYMQFYTVMGNKFLLSFRYQKLFLQDKFCDLRNK